MKLTTHGADLDHTSIFYDMGEGAVNVVDLPAKLNMGGGEISYTFSAQSDPVMVRIDRLAPAPPF